MSISWISQSFFFFVWNVDSLNNPEEAYFFDFLDSIKNLTIVEEDWFSKFFFPIFESRF